MSKSKVEFGDFQTPPEFAAELVTFLRDRGSDHQVIIEPTCGTGSFLKAASGVFPHAKLLGVELNAEHVFVARRTLGEAAEIRHGSFFETDWDTLLDQQPSAPLFLGNPPWVTNSGLGAIGGSNLPEKANLKYLSGLDALTGKSNFDISEWMLIKLLNALQKKGGTVAMLCKTAVARKVLQYASDGKLDFSNATIVGIDAMRVFGAAVEACFFTFEVVPGRKSYRAAIQDSLGPKAHVATIGVTNGRLIADPDLYDRSRHLEGLFHLRWRSGVKHDCSKIMEFTMTPHGLLNGLGENVHLEDDIVFPLLKSSDIANGRVLATPRRVLITQSTTGEDTAAIGEFAPRAWRYLLSHADLLDARKSSIYRGRPRFSIFGIGDYSFAPWKVAISGLYKSLEFQVVPPHEGKSVMLDDTCYFLGFHSEDEARVHERKLRSQTARDYLNSVVFWDAKRPINTEILQRLDLAKIPGT